MKLTEFFSLNEMARPVDRAGWAVLDWAAQHGGEFTMDELYAVYRANGGKGSPSNFHTFIGHRTAKQHKADELDKSGKPYWPPSDNRPFTYATRGGHGAGKKHVLRWGIDHPLREPQEADPEFDFMSQSLRSDDDENDPVGDALDRLERGMDRMPLKAAIQRWRNMNDINRIIDDIKKEVPARLRMDAVRVATANLLAKGKVDRQDVKDAEREVQGGIPLKSTSGKSATDIDIDDDELAGDWEEAEDTEESEPLDFDPLDILKEPPAPATMKSEPEPETPRKAGPPPVPQRSSPPPAPVDKTKLTQEPVAKKGPPPVPSWLSKTLKLPKKPPR